MRRDVRHVCSISEMLNVSPHPITFIIYIMGGKKNVCVKSWQLNRAFYHYGSDKMHLKVFEIMAEADKSVNRRKKVKKKKKTSSSNHLTGWLLLLCLIDYKSV